MRARLLLSSAAAVLSTALLVAQTASAPPRVFATGQQRFTDVEAVVADLARADLVFVGSPPGSAEAHRFALGVLEGLAARGREVVVAMEVFERTAQEPLDHFLMGHLTEADVLAASPPDPRYATDHKPLVDLAVRRNWPIIATSAPRALVTEVARGGLEVLQMKSDADRALVSRDVRCTTDDAEFNRFQASVARDSSLPGATAEGGRVAVDRAYLAQCLRAETMAETIAQVLNAGTTGGRRPLVVSVNSASLSDFGGGAVARARRRLPDKRLLVLSVVPVTSLDARAPDAGPPHRGDYVVYVPETVKR